MYCFDACHTLPGDIHVLVELQYTVNYGCNDYCIDHMTIT